MPWEEGLAASSVPWTPLDPTYRPRCPQGTEGSQDRALALPPTYVTSAKFPPWPSALTSKGHTTRNEGAGKKGGRRLPRELGHGSTQASRQAASHSGHYVSQAPGPHSTGLWAPGDPGTQTGPP